MQIIKLYSHISKSKRGYDRIWTSWWLAISAIGSLVEELHTFIGTDPDIIFGTKENNALQKNMIDFRLIVTGIDKEISIWH